MLLCTCIDYYYVCAIHYWTLFKFATIIYETIRFYVVAEFHFSGGCKL